MEHGRKGTERRVPHTCTHAHHASVCVFKGERGRQRERVREYDTRQALFYYSIMSVSLMWKVDI